MEFGGVFAVVTIAATIWVLLDAPARGQSRWWALGVFLLWIVFLPWYAIVRSRNPVVPARRLTPRGDWHPDPRDPLRTERYREGERWTRTTRPRARQ